MTSANKIATGRSTNCDGDSQPTPTSSPPPRKKVGILLFDGVEVLDYCGPFEVFSVTRLDGHPAGLPDPSSSASTAALPAAREVLSGFDVLLVAFQKDVPVTTTGGMQVLPQLTFDECPPLDILVVPGGAGTRDIGPPQKKRATLDFVNRQATEDVSILASVCTGALVLAEAGLLDGRRATTHFGFLDTLQARFPKIHVEKALHWVVQYNCVSTSNSPTSTTATSGEGGHGHQRGEEQEQIEQELEPQPLNQYTLYTSAGISAGIDMSLKIVQQVHGEAVARKTARYMEYPFPESNRRRIDL